MSGKPEAPERFSLSRWSRQKLAQGAPADAPGPAPVAAATTPVSSATSAAPELPSVETLGFGSDFTAFLRPEVDETLKRAALKQLFRDPRFNVMDGLDTYVDDYTKADPIEPELLADLLRRGFGPASEPVEAPVPGAAAPAVADRAPPTAAPASGSSEGTAPRSPDEALGEPGAPASAEHERHRG